MNKYGALVEVHTFWGLGNFSSWMNSCPNATYFKCHMDWPGIAGGLLL